MPKEDSEIILIQKYEKLICKIANIFHGIEKEDLIQAGWLGLKKALNNYKEDLGAKFSTYAYPYIFGEMHSLSMSNNDMKINKDILRLCKLVEETRQKLSQINGKVPSNYELAMFLEISEEDIYYAENATLTMLRLEANDNDEEKISLHEIIADNSYILLDESIDLKNTIDILDEQEQKIIKYRYFKDYTQSETAKALGITQVQVSRCENKSLEKMRQYVA